MLKSESSPPKILFIVGGFPAVSETFIWREALSFAASGASFLSVGRCDFDPTRFPEAVAKVVAQTDYRRDTLGERAGVLLEALRRPIATLKAIRLLAPHYPPGRIASRLYAFLRTSRRLRADHATILHAHWKGPADIAWLMHSCFGIPYTMFLHAHDIYDEGLGDPAHRALFETKINAAESIFTCTAANVRVLKSHFPLSDVRLSYHGVDDALLESPRENALQDRDASLRLVSAGRLVAYKGFSDVVPLARRLRELGVDFTWTIIGNGSLRSEMEAGIEAEGLTDRVRLLGERPNRDVVQTMREGDAFVFLGKQDAGQYGLPNVLLEASAAGLCVITRPLDTTGELIESGRNGFILEGVEEIATLISDLAADRPRVKRIGAQAHADVAGNHRHSANVADMIRSIKDAATNP